MNKQISIIKFIILQIFMSKCMSAEACKEQIFFVTMLSLKHSFQS